MIVSVVLRTSTPSHGYTHRHHNIPSVIQTIIPSVIHTYDTCIIESIDSMSTDGMDTPIYKLRSPEIDPERTNPRTWVGIEPTTFTTPV